MIRAGLIMLLSAVAYGQSFEVASIKPHDGPMYRPGVATSGQRLTADAAKVRTLVMYAYNVKNLQVTGTVPLLTEDKASWDIIARAEGDTIPTRAEFRKMLQSLLAERFHLKAHREMREMPVYALVLSRCRSYFPLQLERP
jgi:uncharacterized protein (TIGR03435 family)